ncbi:DASH complex subunit Hsk3 like-domain-containing protein [Peziza echinospora]|nr:DASH complex subunit Hsk3 like-domain-containing protein [Peziza echinospora]
MAPPPPPPPPPPSQPSSSYGRHRQSTVPQSSASNKQRQLSHLNSQLAQLHAHISDLENLVRITAVQAEHIRSLGGIHGALLMSAAKVLGEGAGSENETGGDGRNK